MDDDETEVLLHDEVRSPLARRSKAHAEAIQPKSIGPVRNDEGVWVGTCPWCGAKVRLMSEHDPNAFWPMALVPPKFVGVWCDAVVDKRAGKRCEGTAYVAESNPKTMRVRLVKAGLRAGGGLADGSRIVRPPTGLWLPN